jgi:hypothetical protein
VAPTGFKSSYAEKSGLIQNIGEHSFVDGEPSAEITSCRLSGSDLTSVSAQLVLIALACGTHRLWEITVASITWSVMADLVHSWCTKACKWGDSAQMSAL